MEDSVKSTQNHYDVLGLEREAALEDVKSAYRLRSHMFHPDKYENYPEPLRSQLKYEAAKEFKKLTAAYDVLRDPQKRAAHDRALGSGRYARAAASAGPTVREVRPRTRRTTSTASAPEEEQGPSPRAARARGAAGSARAVGGATTRERDPLLVVRPDRLEFGTMALGTTKQLPLKISNAGGRTLFGEVNTNRAWLSVNRRSFISSSSVLFVSVDTSGLQPGEEYAGSLVVSTLNGGDQVVPIYVRVSGRPEPILAGAPSLLDFGVAATGGVRARTIKLTNAGTGTLIGSVAVKGSWLAVSESRFRGNSVSFEAIANAMALPPGEHRGEVLIFSNGGRAIVEALVDVPAPATGGAIVAEEGGREGGSGRTTEDAPQDSERWEAQEGTAGTLTKEEQRSLLERVLRVEPATDWEHDFLRGLVQLLRAGDRLAPGELAKLYELEARRL